MLFAARPLLKPARNSPRFMAFFPAPTSYPSLLGEMYSSAFAPSAFNWDCAPAATELEIIAMGLLGKMLDLPSGYYGGKGGGMLQRTTSEAVLNVIVAARERYLFQSTTHLQGLAKDDLLSKKKEKLVVLGQRSLPQFYCKSRDDSRDEVWTSACQR